MIEILLLLSSGILGIFVGAQIAEAILLVPYWKSLSPDDFFELHRTYGKKIHQFFAPLTIAATVLPMSTFAYSFVEPAGSTILFLGMGISTLLFFSSYFLFFKKANKAFAERTLSNEELPQALARWEKWHWGRIVFECIALVCALLLLY